jgi:hypothetical protein
MEKETKLISETLKDFTVVFTVVNEKTNKTNHP